MPRSGSFIRDQSTSTDTSEILHQSLLGQQLFLHQTPPLEFAEETPSRCQKSKIGSIHPPELIYPKSRYHGYIPPIPTSEEHQACAALLQEINNHDLTRDPVPKEDFVEFELTEFSVYMPDAPLYGWELRGLQDLASKHRHSCFLFDGILSVKNSRYYVQRAPFRICSIGNYGEEVDDVDGAIWLQSDLNTGSDIYYRLNIPAPEYARFHSDFLWLANLSKHFVDYSLACQEQRKRVSIHNFRSDFAQWGRKVHAGSAKFQSWYLEFGRDDFRQAISANIGFLFKESVGVTEKLRSLYIWKEILEKSSIEQHPIEEIMTIVTPYVYDCFSHLRFGHLLKPLVPKVDTQELDRQSIPLSPRKMRITRDANLPTQQQHPSPSIWKDSIRARMGQEGAAKRQQMIDAIKVGDVISVIKDGPKSVWKDETSRWKTEDHCWYLYVQVKHQGSRGQYSFDGIWLYQPSDTSCAKMKYPYPKELFLSDNCTCGSRGSRIPQDEVIDIVPVIWHGSPSEMDIFIRQAYLCNDKFVTLTDAHKTCEHLRPAERDSPSLPKIIDCFPIGQTVLALPPWRESKNGLEPYEIVKYDEESSKPYVTLRRLLRRSELDPAVSCRPNELVYTDFTDRILASKLEEKCLVRFYSEKQISSGGVPAPYCRNGGSNAFVITKRLRGDDQKLIAIEQEMPESLIQGFDPQAPLKRKLLNGLDLFCGGGNFGRGLEEGGALHNKWAVDLFSAAVQTYSANLKDPGKTDIFFGSVNDLLAQAFEGNPQKLKIPLPGDVDVIMAGSPCQGFSKMNVNRSNEQSLRNQSLVASVAAYIDFYRPKYGLLENVLSMAQKGLGRDEDVLSQLLCAIVGLGYQVQLFLLDAWSFGSSQSRSRIFVSFAAPGCTPLKHPQLSHSHPPHVGERGLGKLANGQSFGSRVHCATPFKYRTAEESVADLPYIGDGATSQCIKYPDHVSPITLSKLYRYQIACIPTHPRGMNFWKTWNDGKGRMTQKEREIFPYLNKAGKTRECVIRGSRGWGRIKPDGFFPTIMVTMNVEDSRMGNILHWDQHRRMTIMELRRAQSFPDHEVLVGSRGEQVKIIGNSVDRTVSMALGISLRDAWLKSAPEVDGALNLAKSRSSIPMREKPRQIPSNTAPSTFEFVPNKRPQVREYNGAAALASSSSDSVVSNPFESIANPRGIRSRIQKKRYSNHVADEPARKSPRLSSAIDLKSRAMELFAKSLYNPEWPSGSTTQSDFETRPERISPGSYFASPPAPRNVPPHNTNTPRNANHINAPPPSSRGNPITIDDSEAEKWVDSGSHASNILHRHAHSRSRTRTPKTASRPKRASSQGLDGKSSPHVIVDLAKSASEDQASRRGSSNQPQSPFEVIIPVFSSRNGTDRTAHTSSSRFTSRRSQSPRANELESGKGRKYVPVNNSQFDAYAQTNRVMKNMARQGVKM
ncbi:hypothetical protein DSL72_003309 [Monilinia vaccinii-corymbosi]|uniref:DNA (cytosine-5-)-methyltransferase n=1 Tax=Monilinia vaccinii-corymbosi TaxID=61207 RepID=A0A8A3NZD1_9HELO|nr:hypothetical protein DSL72_003309 [Monilinia vaccinii-corymbosi]